MNAKERKELNKLADKMISDSVNHNRVMGLQLVLRVHAQTIRRAARGSKK